MSQEFFGSFFQQRTFFLPLFLVSFATVGSEIALTRYFAVATWSEYGYWVISIVLAGFAFSGVALGVARDWFARRAETVLALLPPLLVLSAAGGTWFATINPFNPLQLQNAATLVPQLENIAGYYAAFLPFYTLAGLFIGLCFTAVPDRIGLVYGTDLIGAGCGSLLTLLLMFVVPPFRLVPCLLVFLAAAGLCMGLRWPLVLASLAALVMGETLLLGFDHAAINEYKAIYAPLHVQDSRTVATLPRPGGLYMLLDDFTERLDTDVSNNATTLGFGDPPAALGLYRDGNRIAALPRGRIDAAYAGATRRCLTRCCATRAFCWLARLAAFAWRKRRRSALPRSTLLSRNRCCCARYAMGSHLRRRSLCLPGRACQAIRRWRWHAAVGITTLSIFPATLPIRLRPTRRVLRARRLPPNSTR